MNTDQEKVHDRLFVRWMQKNANADAPILFSNSYRNFVDPIGYIKDENIQKKQQNLQNVRREMHQQKGQISQFSTSIYKKVVSRDSVNYKFGATFIGQTNTKTNKYQDDLQKRHQKKSSEKQRSNIKRDELKKTFLHGADYLKTAKEQNTNKPLTMETIKLLDTPQFQEQFKNTQFYSLFAPNSEQVQKYINPYEDISENYDIDQLMFKIRFPLFEHQNFYGPKSNQLIVRFQEEMDFWRRNQNAYEENKDQIQIIKRCQNFNKYAPSAQHMLEYSSGKIDGEIINRYYKLKKKHDAELKLDENDQNLEEEYNRKKEQYQFLKELKMRDRTQKIAIKHLNNATQTIDKLEQTSFDSYFQENAKDLIIKLKQLNQMRDLVIEDEQDSSDIKAMLTNIGYEIKDILFRLLCLLFKGENFPEYQKFIYIDDRKVAEKKILQLIYHSFNKITVLEVDGIPKSKIISIYLQQREKNDKMFELIGRMLPYDKPKR